MTTTLVEIITENNIKGYGATYSFSPFGIDISVAENAQHFARLLISEKLLDIKILHNIMQTYRFAQGLQSISAIDIALWDCKAKSQDKPLYKLFTNKELQTYPVYASTTLNEYIRHIDDLISQGYNSVKLHVQGDYNSHIELCKQIKTEFPHIELMLDSDCVYNLEQSIAVAKELEEINLKWLEAPMPDGNINDYAQLKKQSNIKIIAGGNTLLNIPEIKMAFELQTVDSLRVDASIHGGITACLKMIELANQLNTNVEFQSWGWDLNLMVNLQVMCGFDNTGKLEIPVPNDGFQFANKNMLSIGKDSHIKIPQQSGTGVDLDMNAIINTKPYIIKI